MEPQTSTAEIMMLKDLENAKGPIGNQATSLITLLIPKGGNL